MSQETTYLKLSEVDGAHKFHEVIVDNALHRTNRPDAEALG